MVNVFRKIKKIIKIQNKYFIFKYRNNMWSKMAFVSQKYELKWICYEFLKIVIFKKNIKKRKFHEEREN